MNTLLFFNMNLLEMKHYRALISNRKDKITRDNACYNKTQLKWTCHYILFVRVCTMAVYKYNLRFSFH